MHKQVKAFYDMANEYHIAAASLWVNIVDSPYLYNPVSFLLRHTIELQLKGLIVSELRKDCNSLKISEIKIPSEKKDLKMDSVHSLKTLWNYFQGLYKSHRILVDEEEFRKCEKALSKINKKDFSSTRYRYPFTKQDVSINLEPIDIRFCDSAPDISTRIPVLATNGEKLSVIKKGSQTWLEIIRGSVEKTTFSSYTQMVKKKIAPYFRDTGLTLGGIQAKHIQSFYLHELKSVSASTVIHEHANIHKALKYAVKMDLIPFNPADKVERPKKQKYIADYYRLDELEKLFDVTKDHPYSLLIQMTAFYGLRRSEALGLKWDAIDFERNTITIRHIVTEAEVDGKSVIISEDRAKTKSSLRSLPSVGHFREKLLELKEQQKENRRVCGNCYNCEYDGYIFVDAMGTIFNPNAVTENFSKILKRNGLRHIRFHCSDHLFLSIEKADRLNVRLILLFAVQIDFYAEIFVRKE